jgi:hypothetical protein
MSKGSASWLTPPKIAKQFGIDPAKVVGWIRRGELVAVNVADRTGGRPRWRIASDDLDAFLLRRRSQPPALRPARRKHPADVIEFY